MTRYSPWLLLATLGVLVAITIPELGVDAWPFMPAAVHPTGILGPLVRIADREWDLGTLRSTAVLAGLLVALVAAATWWIRDWPRWFAIALPVHAVAPGGEALVELGSGSLEQAVVGRVADQDVTEAIRLPGLVRRLDKLLALYCLKMEA